MADKTTTSLTAGSTPLVGTELVYGVQGGNSRKFTASQVAQSPHTQAWGTITGTPTTLTGYGITDAQPLDANLTAIAALTTTGYGRAFLALADEAAFKAYVNLEIGTDVQAFGATLTSLEGLSLVNGDILYSTGADTLARRAIGSSGQVLQVVGGVPTWQTVGGTGDLISTNNLSDVANVGTARTNLGLAIGTNVQAFSTNLSTLAAVTPGTTGLALLDDTTPAAARTTIGTVIGTDVQAFNAKTVIGPASSTNNGLVRWNGTTGASAKDGGLLFNADVDALAAIVATKLSFTQAGSGAVARTVQDELASYEVTLEQYGGAGDDATDNITAFAAANTYLNGVGGGSIRLGRGKYRLSAAVTLSSKNSIIGQGRNTELKTMSATANILNLGGNQVVRDIYFSTGVTRTAGVACKMNAVGQIVIVNNMFIDHVTSVHIEDNCTLIWVLVNSIYKSPNAASIGIRIDGPTAVGNDYFIRDNFIRGAAIGTQGVYGIYHARSGGTYMSGNSVLWCGTGLELTAPTGTATTWFFSTNDTFDSGTGVGVHIQAVGTGTLTGVFFDGLWAATNGQAGVQVANAGGTIDGVQFNHPRIFNNSFYGIDVAAGPINVKVDGGATCGNSGASLHTYHGINFAANCLRFAAMGVDSGTAYGFSNSQGYGIVVQSGTSNFYRLLGNNTQGNFTGGILDLGSGVTKAVANNI